MSVGIRVTRAQLSEFIKNQGTINQFEILIRAVDESSVDHATLADNASNADFATYAADSGDSIHALIADEASFATLSARTNAIQYGYEYISAGSAGTASHLILDSEVGSLYALYPFAIWMNITGGTAWTDPTATVVKIQDTSGVVAFTVPKALLVGGAVVSLYSAGVTVGNAIKAGSGLTQGKGIDVVGDANFSTGSNMDVTVLCYRAYLG